MFFGKTYFSFKYGTYATQELVQAAAEQHCTALALTNINNTCDVWDFVDDCQQHNIKPIVGVEVRQQQEWLYTLLAINNEGVHDINLYLSVHMQQKLSYPQLFAPSSNVAVLYPLQQLLKPEAAVKLENLNAHEYIAIGVHEISKLYSLPMVQYAHKFILHHAVTFQNKLYYNAHRLLRAIEANCLLSKLPPHHVAGTHEHFVDNAYLVKATAQYPYLYNNAVLLFNSCNVSFTFNTDNNKKQYGPDDKELLHKLAIDGLKYRYGANNTIAKQRVLKELDIINKLGFNTYFLIAWDVIRYAQNRNFFYVGRGSGANSIVAYCLQITDVDPIELDLYFERFLNPYRTSPPDFDIDFSWQDRDELIDYVFKRYGKHHVCLLGMYSTYQHKATVRELGKVFGLPKPEIDAMLNRYNKDANPDKTQQLIYKYSSLLTNFPSHQSIHPGGILISEKPLYNYAAIDMPPKGFATAQVDMFVAEKIGLYKLDILSQRGLGHIKDTVELVKHNQHKHIDIHNVQGFKTDERVKKQIQCANTIGCFYIESPAMRQLLHKLRCSDYLTLVAASSIIRPGVSKSGMMREYIHRFHHPKSFTYLHPKMEELLKETYGVMVYQEDVIKVAHHFAGLDMGEADILRRAMSGKYRGSKEMIRIREKFFENCAAKNYDEAIAHEVWRQIESFSGYSFSKAHSASFAVESYQSLYLKTYYPREFMVAVINNFGGFYSTELYVHELRKTGAAIHAPCVNNSTTLTNISGNNVYIGFTHIQGLEHEVQVIIQSSREVHGIYNSLQDFMHRTHIASEQLNILIRIGALRFTGLSKKELLWHANFIQPKHTPKYVQDTVLFTEQLIDVNKSILPTLPRHTFDDVLDEMELLGFSLQNPFCLVDAQLDNYIPSQALPNYLGKQVTVLGYWVTSKPVYTVNKELMLFGTFIDADGNWIDTVHFPKQLQQYPVQGRGFYHMQGKVIQEFGVYGIEVHYLHKVGLVGRNAVKLPGVVAVQA
jgi:DNA-directed DNA polymerase III PolC